MSYSLVFSDELLKEFYSFKANKDFDKNIIERLLQHYKSSYLTNVAQLRRIGIDDTILFASLLSSGFDTQDLEDLTKQTKYKLILNTTSSNYPYLNIFSDEIESNFTATYYKNKNRDKAKEHIKALLENAKTIFVYDKYILNQWQNSKKLFTELVPKKPINIFYTEKQLETKESEIKSIYEYWKIKEDKTNVSYRKLHDRYIIIDGKIELILTSGIDNLFDDTSDFTYIIKEI